MSLLPTVPLLPSNSVMLMPPPDEKNVTSLNEAVTSVTGEQGKLSSEYVSHWCTSRVCVVAIVFWTIE